MDNQPFGIYPPGMTMEQISIRQNLENTLRIKFMHSFNKMPPQSDNPEKLITKEIVIGPDKYLVTAKITSQEDVDGNVNTDMDAVHWKKIS